MRTDDAPAKHVEIHLRDYAPPAWIIDETRLEFTLNPTATRVQARIAFRRNPDGAAGERPDLRLDGQALTLIAAAIDGVDIRPHLHVTDDGLTLAAAHLPG